jgi:hypothetical protein
MLKSTCLSGLTLAFMLSCSDERSLHLSSDPGPSDGDARARRMDLKVSVDGDDPQETDLRSLTRDYILEDCFRILKDDPGDTIFDNPSASKCTATQMVDQEPACTGECPEGAPPTPPVFKSMFDCPQVMCDSLAAVCVAHRLLELASTAAPVSFTRPGSPASTVVVPPQDAESSVWLAEDAWYYAANAA